MTTTDEIAAKLFPDANGETYKSLRPMFTAAETSAIVETMSHTPRDIATARAQAVKLLTAEFGADKAQAAYDGAIAFAKNSPAIRDAAKNPALGNSPQAILTIAKAVARRANNK